MLFMLTPCTIPVAYHEQPRLLGSTLRHFQMCVPNTTPAPADTHTLISVYSNSLLATLITRYELRNSRDRSTSDGIVDLDMFNMRRVNILTPVSALHPQSFKHLLSLRAQGTSFNQPMQVSVKQSVIQYGPDGSTEAEI